jgi:DNA-binding transcriptional MerR regulator
MSKSPDAFRTISEVADWLGVQAHVLRFWESKFSQVKPVKRAGGRRYYRPADMLLLGGIRKLLHDDGLTIKGVQKILREQGMAYVSDLSLPLDDETMEAIDAATPPTAAPPFFDPPPPMPEPKAGEVVEFPPVTPPEAPDMQPEAAPEPMAEAPALEMPEAADVTEMTSDEASDSQPPQDKPEAFDAALAPATPDDVADPADAENSQPSGNEALDAAPHPLTPEEVAEHEETATVESDDSQPSEDEALAAAPSPVTPDDVAEREESATVESDDSQPSEDETLAAAPPPVTPEDVAECEDSTTVESHDSPPSEGEALDAAPASATPPDALTEPQQEAQDKVFDDAAPIHSIESQENSESATETGEAERESPEVAAVEDVMPAQDDAPVEAGTDPETQDEPDDDQAVPAFLSTSKMAEDTPIQDKPEAPAPKPRVIDAPDPPAEDQIDAQASTLSALARVKRLAPEQQESLRPLLAQLTALRDRMAAGPKPRSKD